MEIMKQFIKTVFSTFFLFAPFLTFAHEGHGFFHGHQPAHYLTSPAHVIPIAVVLGCTIAYFVWRALARREKADR